MNAPEQPQTPHPAPDHSSEEAISPPDAEHLSPRRPAHHRSWVPFVLGGLVVGVLLLGGVLLRRAQGGVNRVALESRPRPVTVIEAKASSYRGTRRYVATIEPWLEARVGPQLISAYVEAVLFRPGATVKKNEVLATLDCRNASAQSQGVAMLARSIEARQTAVERESARVSGMLDGGFVSQNEVDRKRAESEGERSELLAARARMLGSQIQVNDCVLRAPFDGEVSARLMDPGAFAHPGVPILELVDRTIVRVSADVPEIDFDVVAPGTSAKITLLARGTTLTGTVSRRSPAADAATRTVHAEFDLADPARAIPVGTTAEVIIEVGEAVAAAEIPLTAASVRGPKATVFVVEGDTAHKLSLSVLGERGGSLFVATTLAPGARLVTEGRSTLNDGDHVVAQLADAAPPAAPGGAKEGSP
jgi:RND family efflux transporter MFP subunit